MLRGGSAGSSTRDSRSGSLQRMVRRCGLLDFGVEFGNLADGVDATGVACGGVEMPVPPDGAGDTALGDGVRWDGVGDAGADVEGRGDDGADV